MGSEWSHTTIGDQITLQRGFDITRKEQRPGKVPVISSGGISSYHDTAKQSGPGVIMGRKGSLGTVFYVEDDYWPHDTTLWIKDFHGNDERFAYYFFKNIAPQLLDMDVGAANPTLNRNHVHPIEILWPPLPEQKAIAHILGTLDDKIELNRRMNATLEGMAQALFKSWFVDFDPVLDNAILAGNPIPEEFAERAKVRRAILEQNQNDECSMMNDELKDSSIHHSSLKTHHSPQAPSLAAGNPIPDELAPRAEVRKNVHANGTTQQGSLDHSTLSDPKSLFPASFEYDDELGPIPDGWEAKRLGELATVTKGKSYKSSELESSTTALVTLKSFNRGGGYRLDGLKEYTGAYKPEQVVESGDLIISYTDVTQAADVIGKPAMVIPDERYETLVISLDVGVVRPSGPTLKHFLYQLARTKRFEDWMLSHTSGTTVLHLSKNAFPSFECAFPDEELISEFEKIVSPLFERTVQNVKESRALTKLRDTLLPKLISGDLRLPNNEKLRSA